MAHTPLAPRASRLGLSLIYLIYPLIALYLHAKLMLCFTPALPFGASLPTEDTCLFANRHQRQLRAAVSRCGCGCGCERLDTRRGPRLIASFLSPSTASVPRPATPCTATRIAREIRSAHASGPVGTNSIKVCGLLKLFARLLQPTFGSSVAGEMKSRSGTVIR